MRPLAKRFSIPLVASLLVALLMTSFAGAQTSSSDLAGWANVPGGQVWLRPGLDAYEHDTGLVRDLNTGRRSAPITPQASRVQGSPHPPAVVLVPAYQPVYQPAPIYQPPVAPIPTSPSCPNCRYPANPYYSPRYNNVPYDVGPYGNMAGQNYGFQSPATSSQRLRDSYQRIK